MRPKRKANFSFKDVAGPWSDCGLPGFPAHLALRDITSTSSRKTGRKGAISWSANPGRLRLRMEALTDFHLALPETESFLKADLSKNTADELAYAESAH